MSDEAKLEMAPNAVAQLSKADYWEWRCSLEEITSAKHLLSLTQQRMKTMELEAEIQKLRILVFKNNLKAANDNLEKIEKDFKAYRSSLESKLGISLTECVIDEFDYTIKKL